MKSKNLDTKPFQTLGDYIKSEFEKAKQTLPKHEKLVYDFESISDSKRTKISLKRSTDTNVNMLSKVPIPKFERIKKLFFFDKSGTLREVEDGQ